MDGTIISDEVLPRPTTGSIQEYSSPAFWFEVLQGMSVRKTFCVLSFGGTDYVGPM